MQKLSVECPNKKRLDAWIKANPQEMNKRSIWNKSKNQLTIKNINHEVSENSKQRRA